MERELRAVVRWVLDDSPARDCSDLALLMLTTVIAKTNWSSDGLTHTTVPELGRWAGNDARKARDALGELRKCGAVVTREQHTEAGSDSGLTIAVPALVGMRRYGYNPGHPLAPLCGTDGKKKLATFLRLCEALFGPGWTHRDGRTTPPGLLGRRRGKGAATDRLALLVLRLETRPDGRVRLCGGVADKKHGRAATTLARLLRRTPGKAVRILTRLVDYGVVERPRRGTASGLNQRSDYGIPAVAEAAQRAEGRAPVTGRNLSTPDPSDSAWGVEPQTGTASPQVIESRESDRSDVADPSDSAPLHTDHAPVAALGGQVEESSWFPAAGGTGLSHDGGYAREAGKSALRAEENNTTPILRRDIPATIRSAVPGLFELMTPGQRGTAARDITVCLQLPGWTPDQLTELLADRLTRRFAPMSLTDPETGRGYIGGGDSPFRWLRRQLPARAMTYRQEQAAYEEAERARLERLEDGMDPDDVRAKVSARLAAESAESAARAAAREEARRLVAEYEQAREEAENRVRTQLGKRGTSAGVFGALLNHHMARWDAKNPAPKTTTTAA